MPVALASRPSTATSWRATWRTRSSCSAVGRRRASLPSARCGGCRSAWSTLPRSSSSPSSRSRPTRARRRRASSGRRSSSSTPSANRSWPGRTTSRPPHSHCGGATSATPVARSIAAGPACARPRSGCSSRGWPRWWPRSTPRRRSQPESIGSLRRWRRRGNGRPPCSTPRPHSCVRRAPRRRPARVASPMRHSPPDAPSSGGSKVTMTRPSGAEWPATG